MVALWPSASLIQFGWTLNVEIRSWFNNLTSIHLVLVGVGKFNIMADCLIYLRCLLRYYVKINLLFTNCLLFANRPINYISNFHKCWEAVVGILLNTQRLEYRSGSEKYYSTSSIQQSGNNCAKVFIIKHCYYLVNTGLHRSDRSQIGDQSSPISTHFCSVLARQTSFC